MGNSRVSYTEGASGNAQVVEENSYYAFGLQHKGYGPAPTGLGNAHAEKYKYNGKELQDELGLNMYDYGARNYEAAIGRWMNVDPLAEVSRRWSPYTYCYNNPVYFVDPDGMRAADSEVFNKVDSFENSYGMGSEGCKTCDYILGYTAALVDNNLFGASGAREVASRFVSDAKSFNHGQTAGDVTSIVMGGAEFTGGSTLASGAASVTAGSGGASAEVSVPAALGGALIAAHGAVVGMNAANSLASGKGRMDEAKGSDKASSSNAARREAMRNEGIPTSQQPKSQSRNSSGKEYSYEVPKPGGGKQTKSVQQQTMDRSHQGQPHWEAGKVKTDNSGNTRINSHGRSKLQNDKSKVYY